MRLFLWKKVSLQSVQFNSAVILNSTFLSFTLSLNSSFATNGPIVGSFGTEIWASISWFKVSFSALSSTSVLMSGISFGEVLVTSFPSRAFSVLSTTTFWMENSFFVCVPWAKNLGRSNFYVF